MSQLQADIDSLRKLLLEHPEGLGVPQILEMGWDKERLKNAASALKQAVRNTQVYCIFSLQKRIEVAQHATFGILFTAVPDEVALRFADLSTEHRAVFKLISDAGNQGMWAKDLAGKSKIPAGTLARLTKMLEHRKLIKQITPAQYRSRKVWMLYELEPASELSGGSWYKDGQIDSDLISRLRQVALEYVSNTPGNVSVDDIQKFLAGMSLSRSYDNIASIVNTLVLDGELYQSGPSLFSLKSKCSIPEFSHTLYSSIPCIGCPVRRDCAPGHVVSPETCVYMNKWLGISEL